jgi:hypothetical protein
VSIVQTLRQCYVLPPVAKTLSKCLRV